MAEKRHVRRIQNLSSVINYCRERQNNEVKQNNREGGETALSHALNGSKKFLRAQGYLHDEEGDGK